MHLKSMRHLIDGLGENDPYLISQVTRVAKVLG